MATVNAEIALDHVHADRPLAHVRRPRAKAGTYPHRVP